MVSLFQFVLIRTKLFRGEVAGAAFVAILTIVVFIIIGAFSGAFNFW